MKLFKNSKTLKGRDLKKQFWTGILVFLPSWALANGLLFLPRTSQIDVTILVLSFVELAGIVLIIGGLLFEFKFYSYWKIIIIIGVLILLVGYWVINFVIFYFYPQPAIPLDFLRQIFMPPIWIQLIPAATEIIGIIIILTSIKFSEQKVNETKITR